MKHVFFKLFFSFVFFILLFILGCDDGFQQVRSYECTWNGEDIIFSNVSLSAPICEEVQLDYAFQTPFSPYTSIINVFLQFPESTSLEWYSTGALCSSGTSTSDVTLINSINDPRLTSIGFNADEALTNVISLNQITGHLQLKVEGITNYFNGEVGMIVWEQEFKGNNLFHSESFVQAGRFIPNSYSTPIYYQGQYIQF